MAAIIQSHNTQRANEFLSITSNIVILFVVAMISRQPLIAKETETNWNWLKMSMTIPRTNFYVGEEIPVSIVVSNLSQDKHPIQWYVGDPCNYGLGHFEIIDLKSGIDVNCRLTKDERASLAKYYLTYLRAGSSKVFKTGLTEGYSITNAGNYKVQAVAWFPINESPTNRKDIPIVTPPIFFSLSSKSETNSSSK